MTDTGYLEQRLQASDPGSYEYFGSAVGLSGSNALIGAPRDDVGTNEDQGSAYAFVRLAGGTWIEVQKVVATDGRPDEEFGIAVSVDGRRALVGSPYDNVPDANTGSAYMFEWNGAAWSQLGRLASSQNEKNDNLGLAVSLDGGTALVGAPNADAFDGLGVVVEDQGAAYVFELEFPPDPPSGFATWAASGGLTDDDALPLAVPFRDTVSNLEKYAFGLDGSQADRRFLVGGTGTSGLSLVEVAPDGMSLRIEFVRRTDGGAIYRSVVGPAANQLRLTTAVPVVTAIDPDLERVVVVEPVDPAIEAKLLGWVEVSLPW